MFKPIQKAIISKFNSDPAMINLDRVLRLPNYLHLKDPSDPFMVKCIKFDPHISYSQEELAISLGCNLSNLDSKTSKKCVVESRVKRDTEVSRNNLTEICVPTPRDPKEFNSLEEAIEFFRQQNLMQLLGITGEIGKLFNCIFHNDTYPSAIIKNDNGQFKYFCNSPDCAYYHENGLDIIDIICKLKSFSFCEAINYLCKRYNITTKWIRTQRIKYSNNIDLLSHREFFEKYSYLNRVIRSGTKVLAGINEIGFENISFEHFSFDDEHVFFFSNRYLAKKIDVSPKLVNKYVNLFCALGLIKKVPESAIPKEFLVRAKQISKQTNQRQINYYVVFDLNEVGDRANQVAKDMLDDGYSSIKSMSRELLVNLFGEDFATGVYSINQESNYAKLLQEEMEKFIIDEIRRKGYVTIDDIYKKTIYVEGEKVSKNGKYVSFKRLIPLLVKSYDFEYRKANKELCQRFGLKGYSYVLYKR